MAHGKVEKTNAARLLDRAKINYELVPYEVDEEHLAATHVAEQLGEEIATVFKTLVLKGRPDGILRLRGAGEITRSISRPRPACRATRRPI